MTVRRRILEARLAELIKRNPSFADKLGLKLSYRYTEKNNSDKSIKGGDGKCR